MLSAVDYFMHTGDAPSLCSWAPLIEAKLRASAAFWQKPTVQGFCGSDSRIGADFEHSPPSEAEKVREEGTCTPTLVHRTTSGIV